MRDVRPDPPAGFIEFSIGTTQVVCAAHVAEAVREALRGGTLYHYASEHPDARPLAGRGIAYAVPLPTAIEQVVVRHNRHGGLFAPLTGDLFRPPTRAAHELHVSDRLRRSGVPTPAFIGYATYAATGGLRRADVMTREIPDSVDLSAVLLSNDSASRADALAATATLVTAMNAAGARHHDLNVKNVLLHRGAEGDLEALVLDVDRVAFEESFDAVREQNLARFLRSARKWQTRYGARVSDAELDVFVRAVRAADPARRTTSS